MGERSISDLFQKENDKVLKKVLDTRFFRKWGESGQVYPTLSPEVEFFITSACNQRCEYCYLDRHGDKLYPPEYRSTETIIRNMEKLLDWFLENEFKIPIYHLFSGEIWGSELGNRVFDTLLAYKLRGLFMTNIVIPSNVSFILSDEKFAKVNEYIRVFADHGVRIMFSASVDGPLVEAKTRSFKDSDKNILRDSEFYDKLFLWASEHRYGFHPMVCAESIGLWKDNYAWWADNLKKYGFKLTKDIMFLEVRNDDWNPSNIPVFLDFLEYVFYFQKKHVFYNDIELMALDLFGVSKRDRKLFNDYNNVGLRQGSDVLQCTGGRNLTIRLGDLSLAACHRLSYKDLLFGKFSQDSEGRVEGVASHNLRFATHFLTSKWPDAVLGCDVCEFSGLCMQGCIGSQYEVTKDPFVPIDGVCTLFKNKVAHLLKIYDDNGILDLILKNGFIGHRGLVDPDLLRVVQLKLERLGLVR